MAKWLLVILIAFSTRFVAEERIVPKPIRRVPDVAGIHNIVAIGEAMISGSQPEGTAAFEALRAMGVRVVVSVDGSAPDVASACRAGLRYVHIPIGYDGIHRTEQLALFRVLAENSGSPIFVHCHHGRHRGPAAAAVACRMNQLLDESAARSLLKHARTGEEYAGLWNAVRTCRPVRGDETLPLLKESVTPPEVVALMNQIDQQVGLLRQSAASPETRPADLVATRAVLSQLFRETARLQDAAAYAALLIEAADDLRPGGEHRTGPETAGHWLSRLEKRCTMCHQRYRDNPDSVDSSDSEAQKQRLN